ncbi:hypothetical protein AC249_AIPGENE19994 [Exaiptasia diaphana]|nr:hypothetical protein AC249_AIPGENE19994 [Exaiptasia diaphana]
MPMNTYYKVWVARQKDAGMSSFLSYQNFRFSWYAFLEKLNLHDEMFLCSTCKDSPEIVIFDGTALSFRKNYVPSDAIQKIGSLTKARSETSFTERVLIPDIQARNLLKRYAESQLSSISDVNLLKTLLQKSCPAVIPIIDWILESYGVTSSPLFTSFLKDIASQSPVSSLVLPDNETKELLKIMKETNIKKDPIKLSQLQRKLPFFFNVIGRIQNSEDDLHTLPEAFHPLMDEMWSKAVITTTGTEANCASTDCNTLAECDFVEKLTFFPNLPKSRNRGYYKADKATVRNILWISSDAPNGVSRHCFYNFKDTFSNRDHKDYYHTNLSLAVHNKTIITHYRGEIVVTTLPSLFPTPIKTIPETKDQVYPGIRKKGKNMVL